MDKYKKMNNTEIQRKWRYLQAKIRDDFGTDADITSVLYLIGIQESGAGFGIYTKDEKTALMTIGNHRVLCDTGYYRPAGKGTYEWPLYEQIKDMETMTQEKKDALILEGIIQYFTDIDYI